MQEQILRALASVIDPELRKPITELGMVGDIEVEAQVIATGHAWHYSRYDHTAALEAAERNARAARRGLWVDGDAVPPWVRRRVAVRRGG